MRLDVHHYFHYPESPFPPELIAMIEDMRREVAEARAGQDSAKVMLERIIAKLDELAANATELEALKGELGTLSTELSDGTDSLAAAVAAGPQEAPTP